MSSLLEAAAPKSDQLNACDFLVAARTYTIKDVLVKKDGEQRVSVFFDGVKLPWKPCKSMLRVMMVVWDSVDGKDFIGKKLTLFNDEKVMWAAVAVGGIRISHMSDLPSERTISLRATKKSSVSYTVKPLIEQNGGEKPLEMSAAIEEATPVEITGEPSAFRDTALALYAKAKDPNERNDTAVLAIIAQEWYRLCESTMMKQDDFVVPKEMAEKMHAILQLKKPIGINKGAIDYGGDDVVFLDELVNKEEVNVSQ